MFEEAKAILIERADSQFLSLYNKMYITERIKRHNYILLIISSSDEIDPIGTIRFSYYADKEVEKWENLIQTHLNDSKKE